jgi:hypothetical protein
MDTTRPGRPIHGVGASGNWDARSVILPKRRVKGGYASLTLRTVEELSPVVATRSFPLLLVLPVAACTSTTSPSPAPPLASAVHATSLAEPSADPAGQGPANPAGKPGETGRKPATSARDEPIVFVEDDYDGALAEARAPS